MFTYFGAALTQHQNGYKITGTEDPEGIRNPMKSAEIASKAGIDKAEVDKVIKTLKRKTGSPHRKIVIILPNRLWEI